MPSEQEFREGDTLTIKVRVVRVSDDGELVTIDCWGQRVSGKAIYIKDVVKHEKGNNWPSS